MAGDGSGLIFLNEPLAQNHPFYIPLGPISGTGTQDPERLSQKGLVRSANARTVAVTRPRATHYIAPTSTTIPEMPFKIFDTVNTVYGAGYITEVRETVSTLWPFFDCSR
jgi:hypothetical protein